MVPLHFSPRPAAAELTHRHLTDERYLRATVIGTTITLVRQSCPPFATRERPAANRTRSSADRSASLHDVDQPKPLSPYAIVFTPLRAVCSSKRAGTSTSATLADGS